MPRANRKNRKLFVLSFLILIAAVIGTTAFVRSREVPIAVQTEKVLRRDLIETVVANGRIQPVVQVVINPEVSGEIIELPVKEGQGVRKGDLLVRIKPDNYIAQRNSAEANYQSSLAGRNLAQANLDKARLEFNRVQKLFDDQLVSESAFLEAKTTLAVMTATYETSTHQSDMARAALARAQDDFSKTTILSPTDGTVTRLRSQAGERVVGTAMMAGTEIMTIANLNQMEARVEIGEMDIVLIALGQKARLEVDSFRREVFSGTVTEIASAAKSSNAGTLQESTKFEVRIQIEEKEAFRPGMSVTADIETRYRTNVLTLPIQCVTTRLPGEENGTPKKGGKKEQQKEERDELEQTALAERRRPKETRAEEVVFVLNGNRVRAVPVARGISDFDFVEITDGVEEGWEVVSGSYKAINRELEDGKAVKVENSQNAGPSVRRTQR
jgi:HlyD family secretion protein